MLAIPIFRYGWFSVMNYGWHTVDKMMDFARKC